MKKPTYEELEQQVEELKIKAQRVEEAEKAILKREELNRIVELTPDAITIHDRGKILFANKAFANFVGLHDADDVTGKSLFDFSPTDPVLKKKTEEHAAGIRENRTHSMSEIPVERTDGTLLFAEVSAAKVFYEGKEVILNVHRDISKRKRAEEMLAESKEMYEDLFENASDLIQSIDTEGRFIHVNRKWHEILGYTDDEIDKLSIWDLIHPDSREHCIEVFENIKSGQITDRVEVEFVAKNGEVIPVEGNVNCRFEDDVPVATRGIFRDIRMRKAAEKELQNALETAREANKKLEMAYSKMRAWKDQLRAQLQKNESKFLLNSAGEIIGINDHALDSMGLSRLEVTGAEIYDLLKDNYFKERIRDYIIKASKGIVQSVSISIKEKSLIPRRFEGKLMRIVSKKEKVFLLTLRQVSQEMA